MARTSPSARRSSLARLQLGLACAAVMLAAADTYVVVLALPAIMADVGISLEHLGRAAPVVSGFLLGYVAMLPLLGRLSDCYGRTPVFLACLAGFAAGSLLTASAHDLAILVLGRTIQGLGGGGLVPVTLALVADLWPPGSRGFPLGAVSAVQELGSVLGPLYGALIVTVSTWRTLFWVNLPLAVGLGAGFVFANPLDLRVTRRRGQGLDLPGIGLAGVASVSGVTALVAPGPLADSDSWGVLFVPLAPGGSAWEAWTSPLLLAATVAGLAFCGWELWAPRTAPRLVPLRQIPQVLVRADALGALLLSGCLGLVVITFAGADGSREVVRADAPALLPAAGAVGLAFIAHERRHRNPLIAFAEFSDRAAAGALLTNLAIGAALMAAVIDVPVFARATAFPDSQVGAALALIRFLAAVPVGALAGGAICERASYRATAAAGMAVTAAMFAAMTRWDAAALSERGILGGPVRVSDVVLAVCGFGFGLAIAPVNNAILGAVRPAVHGVASALVVVARMIGMLVGLSALTAAGLRTFYDRETRLPSPAAICPRRPTTCEPYNHLVRGAIIDEMHTIFAGAALCAAVAAILAGFLLRRRQGVAAGFASA